MSCRGENTPILIDFTRISAHSTTVICVCVAGGCKYVCSVCVRVHPLLHVNVGDRLFVASFSVRLIAKRV